MILSFSDNCLVIKFLFFSAKELIKSFIISIWESFSILEFLESNEIKEFIIERGFFLYKVIEFFQMLYSWILRCSQ